MAFHRRPHYPPPTAAIRIAVVSAEIGVFRMSPPAPDMTSPSSVDNDDVPSPRLHRRRRPGSDDSDEARGDGDIDDDIMSLRIRARVPLPPPVVLATPVNRARWPPAPSAPCRSAARLAWDNKQQRLAARRAEAVMAGDAATAGVVVVVSDSDSDSDRDCVSVIDAAVIDEAMPSPLASPISIRAGGDGARKRRSADSL